MKILCGSRRKNNIMLRIFAGLTTALCICGHKINAGHPTGKPATARPELKPELLKQLHEKELTVQRLLDPEFQKAMQHYRENEARISQETLRQIEQRRTAFIESISKNPEQLREVLLAKTLSQSQIPLPQADAASEFIARSAIEASDRFKDNPRIFTAVLDLFDADRLNRLLNPAKAATDPKMSLQTVGDLMAISGKLAEAARNSTSAEAKKQAIDMLLNFSKMISEARDKIKDPETKTFLDNFSMQIISGLIEQRGKTPALVAEMDEKHIVDMFALFADGIREIAKKPSELYKNPTSPDATQPSHSGGGYLDQVEYLLINMLKIRPIDPTKMEPLAEALKSTLNGLADKTTAKRGLENFNARLYLRMQLRKLDLANGKAAREKIIAEIPGDMIKKALQDARDFAFDPLVEKLLAMDTRKYLSPEAFDALNQEVRKDIRQKELQSELENQRQQYLQTIKKEQYSRATAKLKEISEKFGVMSGEEVRRTLPELSIDDIAAFEQHPDELVNYLKKSNVRLLLMGRLAGEKSVEYAEMILKASDVIKQSKTNIGTLNQLLGMFNRNAIFKLINSPKTQQAQAFNILARLVSESPFFTGEFGEAVAFTDENISELNETRITKPGMTTQRTPAEEQRLKQEITPKNIERFIINILDRLKTKDQAEKKSDNGIFKECSRRLLSTLLFANN